MIERNQWPIKKPIVHSRHPVASQIMRHLIGQFWSDFLNQPIPWSLEGKLNRSARDPKRF
jgi:hypothetical protein